MIQKSVHFEDKSADYLFSLTVFFIAPKASAEGACIFSKLVTMERV